MLTATFASSVAATATALSLDELSPSALATGGCVLFALLASLWALLERAERRACMKQNVSLFEACRQISEQHYRERVQAEERHLLAFDSGMRNIFESLERAMLGKPKE